MDFLFIHGNYPAQFRHLATLLARDSNHRVVFLTARQDAAKESIPGLEIRTFSCHRSTSPQTHHYLQASEDAVLQGQAVLREISNLVDQGLRPRVVVSHAGMGIGLFIKDLLPQTLHVGYFEWYFQPDTARHLIEKYDLNSQLKTGLRNLPILQELERCDLGVVPTAWQKSQFPVAYHSKLNVIFDGIDTTFFHPKQKRLNLEDCDLTLYNRETGEPFLIGGGQKLLSYATRGMEPLRGFPEFMRSLPGLLHRFSDLQVVIAGADRRAYSYDAPSHGGSWKQYLLTSLGNFEGRERVHFTGLLTYHDYRNLLWRSNLHCYFTRPYVTSWSLFEAAACGARLAVNRSPATSGVAVENSVLWLDLDTADGIGEPLMRGLEDKERPNAQLEPGYELTTSLKQWEELLNRALQSK
ncbi:MAG: glycosyl transferase family 1 [Synechococcus sp. XM-24]|nr:MAG: glycosyl transferase family 1 [Synechococcus sp. XM-24]